MSLRSFVTSALGGALLLGAAASVFAEPTPGDPGDFTTADTSTAETATPGDTSSGELPGLDVDPPTPDPGEVEEVDPEEPPTPPEPADDCRCPVPWGEVMTDDCSPPIGAGPTCGDQTCRARDDDPTIVPTVYNCVYEHAPSEPWEDPPEAEPCSCPTNPGDGVVVECGSVFGGASCSDNTCMVDVAGTLETRTCTDMPVIVLATSSRQVPAGR